MNCLRQCLIIGTLPILSLGLARCGSDGETTTVTTTSTQSSSAAGASDEPATPSGLTQSSPCSDYLSATAPERQQFDTDAADFLASNGFPADSEMVALNVKGFCITPGNESAELGVVLESFLGQATQGGVPGGCQSGVPAPPGTPGADLPQC